ncbi:MAG: MmgE/PrpD family protein [Candidatus Micrarchaeota archaeon]|nr:MmgE/PrpD family protein [Candidatus Micrarchaeota archaeon]MDE1846830.1 MmgE/PrpD family protein [Candidatus Micrarchaeota archaeon]
MSIAEEIAKYVHSVGYSDIDSETVQNAKRRIIDTVGCAIGAAKEPPIRIAMKTLQDTKGSYYSTILGTGRKVDPYSAAFVNGSMSRYFDYMDTYDSKEFSHPSDNIMPIMAVAEAEHKGGKDIILGTVLAYEIQSRLCDAANLWKRGWDHVIYGLVSVSAAASRVMGLDVAQTTQAINISLNSHLTMRQLRAGELSMWKAPAFSNSARNAIFSAMLARNGMTGPAPVFEGEMGFWKEVSGRFTIDFKKFGNRRNRFKLNESALKYFPAEMRSQTAITAALELGGRIGSIDQIAGVEIGTSEAGYKVIGRGKEKWDPKTKETADHSLPYVVAAALMDHKVDADTFKERRFRDRRTLQFMKRIKVREVPEFTRLFNMGGTTNPSDIRIKLGDGGILYEKVIYSRGHPENPMSDEEIEQKFYGLAKMQISEAKSGRILNKLWQLERVGRARELFGVMKW